MVETFSTLWKFSEKQHRNLVSALVFSFVRSAMGITQLMAIIAAVQVLLGTMDPKTGLYWVIGMTVACVAGSFAVSYFEQIFSIKSGMYMTADQRNDVARQMRRMPLGFFRRASAEKIIATLTSTLTGVEMAASMTMIGIVSGFFNAAAMFVFMMFYDWHIGLIMGAGIVAYLLVVSWQMRVSRKDAPRRQAAQTGLAGAALTFLQGIRVIKAFSTAEGDAHLQAAVKESCDANIGLTDRSMPSQFAGHIVIAGFESLLLAMTMYFASSGAFTVEKTIVLLIFSFLAYAALNQAGSILSMIGMLESGLDEVMEIKNAPVLDQKQPEQVPADESICLDHVSFAYGEREVLHDITAEFKPNTLNAIIGPSGSGKTTLCRLIARYQDVNSGSITIGGADVRNIPYETLMEKISMVFQNVYLFEDTVLNNIRFGKPDATLEEVRAAARAARCDEFIMSLPDGYDTMIQEGGSSLSGGEKQRISIARAILKDSPIIILDEATSALDAENERAFFDAVDELTQNKTVLMIAHRLSTVQRADRILAIRDGRVVQDGTPAQLAQQPGLYADFLQSRREAAGWKL